MALAPLCCCGLRSNAGITTVVLGGTACGAAGVVGVVAACADLAASCLLLAAERPMPPPVDDDCVGACGDCDGWGPDDGGAGGATGIPLWSPILLIIPS